MTYRTPTYRLLAPREQPVRNVFVVLQLCALLLLQRVRGGGDGAAGDLAPEAGGGEVLLADAVGGGLGLGWGVLVFTQFGCIGRRWVFGGVCLFVWG